MAGISSNPRAPIPVRYLCCRCKQISTSQAGRKRVLAGWVCPQCVQAREARRRQE